VFAVAVEALFLRALEGKLDPATKARLREAGIDVDEPLLAAYPAEAFHRGVAIAAEVAFPGLPQDEAQRRLGLVHIDGFIRTYPGRMMVALARQLAPRTILESTATFVRLGNNFTETRCRILGPQRAEVWFNEVFGAPHWYRGIIERGLTASNVQGVEVRYLGGQGEATFDVIWTGRGPALAPRPGTG